MTDHSDQVRTGTFAVKRGLADMLRGGVIMDVVTADQAKVAEDAGAVSVMALERVPADIRRDGGVARMSDPALIAAIQEAVTIPVMAKARIGHFAEAQVLQALQVDYIDESEVLTPADEAYHIDKWPFTIPFVCGATNLGEALRRISEGAAMIRSKGEAGTGNVVEAVRHLRSILGDIRKLTQADSAEQYGWAKQLGAPIGLVQEIAQTGRLPVPLFCAGGLATPADVSLVMQLGAEAVFVGSAIFKSEDPARRARAIVEAAAHGLEVECGVLGTPAGERAEGGSEAIASEPGEIVIAGEWYDFRAKYAPGGMELIVPARISPAAAARVRELALLAFERTGCEGLARVDFFVDGERVLLNELNTMPGFTPTSVYAKLLEASGVPYPELVERLCRLGCERHREQRAYSN